MFKKYSWMLSLTASLYWLLRFFFTGYVWWYLIGSIVFGVMSYISKKELKKEDITQTKGGFQRVSKLWAKLLLRSEDTQPTKNLAPKPPAGIGVNGRFYPGSGVRDPNQKQPQPARPTPPWPKSTPSWLNPCQ